jgi:flagellar hook-associated protein 3 FlgL
MNRVSTDQVATQTIREINNRQAKVSDLQQQIASGQRILRPSIDPVGASQAEQTRSDIARAQTERRMVDFAQHKLQQAESAIGSGIDLIQSARDLLLSANNATNGPEERQMFAEQLRSMRDELFNIGNRSDGLGAYVFGGAGTRQPPFVRTGATVEYVAPAGEQLTGSQYQYATSIDGRALFNSVQMADGSRGSVFEALEQTITLLEDETVLSDDLLAGVNVGINALDTSMDQFSGTRARLGEQLAAADRVIAALDDSESSSRARLSDLADTDFAQAISELSGHQTGLDAAMKTYAQISGLSLFDYLR